MTAKLLSKIYYSQGLEKARDRLFRAFDKDKISDEEFVNLTMMLGNLFSGKASMTCHITKKLNQKYHRLKARKNKKAINK